MTVYVANEADSPRQHLGYARGAQHVDEPQRLHNGECAQLDKVRHVQQLGALLPRRPAGAVEGALQDQGADAMLEEIER